ncbi:MAG TPA: YetF domain-containing protein [Thermomicrobiales bacterium]|nr:YetF domain-containing protein [Thermomicrobiales bacterium]
MDYLFDNWSGLGRTLLVGTLAYIVLVLMLRVSGKRTLSKMNAFDFVVTVALGSTLATTLLSQSVALAEGLLAMGLLIALQFAITWLSVRSESVAKLVKNEPSLLYHKGRYLDGQLKRARVTRSEVQAAVRETGNLSMDVVDAVVLETDGSFSVMSGSGKTAPAVTPVGVRMP